MLWGNGRRTDNIHEVPPAKRERISIAGWFKAR